MLEPKPEPLDNLFFNGRFDDFPDGPGPFGLGVVAITFYLGCYTQDHRDPVQSGDAVASVEVDSREYVSPPYSISLRCSRLAPKRFLRFQYLQSLPQYAVDVDQVKGRAMTLSLYYRTESDIGNLDIFRILEATPEGWSTSRVLYTETLYGAYNDWDRVVKIFSISPAANALQFLLVNSVEAFEAIKLDQICCYRGFIPVRVASNE